MINPYLVMVEQADARRVHDRIVAASELLEACERQPLALPPAPYEVENLVVIGDRI